MGWNLNDSTTSLLPDIFPFLSKMIALHQNVANCKNTLTVLTQRWRIFLQVSRYLNGSYAYDTKQLHPSCTACRRTANLPGLAWQNEAWSRPHHSSHLAREREREMFYLTTHSTHFIYGYMASDIWLRTILIVRKETRCRNIGYSYRFNSKGSFICTIPQTG